MTLLEIDRQMAELRLKRAALAYGEMCLSTGWNGTLERELHEAARAFTALTRPKSSATLDVQGVTLPADPGPAEYDDEDTGVTLPSTPKAIIQGKVEHHAP